MEQGIEFGEAGERSQASTFIMPATTLQPMLLAFSLMLIFAGLIFSPIISYVGILLGLLAAIGWWRIVIPQESEEAVPLDVQHRPSQISVDRRSVARLQVGDAQHRVHVPEESHPYSAGILGGLVGGTVMAVLASAYGVLAQHSLWFTVNLLAGVVLPASGAPSLEYLRAFHGAEFIAAVAGHLGLSVLVGVLYAVMLPMFPRYAVLWAGVLMPLFWSGLVATVLNLLNPALQQHISWPAFVVCQLGFGLACGYVIARSERIKTMQTWSLAERARLFASGNSSHKPEN